MPLLSLTPQFIEVTEAAIGLVLNCFNSFVTGQVKLLKRFRIHLDSRPTEGSLVLMRTANWSALRAILVAAVKADVYTKLSI